MWHSRQERSTKLPVTPEMSSGNSIHLSLIRTYMERKEGEKSYLYFRIVDGLLAPAGAGIDLKVDEACG